MSKDYKDKDIVISSRVRLARNLNNIPFPIKIEDNDAMKIVNLVQDSITDEKESKLPFRRIEAESLSKNEKSMLVEKHLTSPEWSKKNNAAVFIRNDEKVSIMINEEDHIRIQCILDGFQLYKAYDIANGIDDILEEKIRFAYDDKYGYLTACPSNVGTGMRASVMLHLPSLTLAEQISGLFQTLARFGITIRGIYGEGSESQGDLYQISNQVTIGITEEQIIANLHGIAKEIIKSERLMRYEVLNNNSVAIEDKVHRALAILQNARIISFEESMKLISLIRLGVDLELLKTDIEAINQLMINIQPGILAHTYGVSNRENLNKIRADHIRNQLG